jgi:hypothetical protein
MNSIWRLFTTLKAEQQAGVLTAFDPVDPGLHQAILDEWDARCRDNAVRHPAGYLFGIIQKALRGEFHVWAGKSPPDKPPDIPAEKPEPASPELAREYLARIRDMMRGEAPDSG